MDHILAGLTPEQMVAKVLNRSSISQESSLPEYKCSKCKDRGYQIEIDGGGYECARECECRVKARTEMIIAKSGISDAFRACTFDNYHALDEILAGAKATAQAYVEAFDGIEHEQSNSFLLVGEVGSGKTMLGVCILNALTARGISVLYAPYRDMVAALKGNVLDDALYRRELERLIKPRVLFIDDLYKGATQNDPKYMYDVINARYLAKKPIIVTSELNADQMLDKDEAVASRILQMSRNFIYEIRGEGLNYRLRGL